MVRICLLSEVDVSYSVTRVNGYFVKWSFSYLCHLQGVRLNLSFFSVAYCAVRYIFPDVLIHAKNFCFESITCLMSNLFTCRKRSTSCFGALPFDRHLEMHLEKVSVLCMCCSACNLSLVSGFSITSGVSVMLVTSGVAVPVLGCRVRLSVIYFVQYVECGSIMVGGR